MKQFVINELSEAEVERLKTYLDTEMEAGVLADIYWIPLAKEQLAKNQQGHEDCGPFAFAVELVDNSVSFELLVRSKTNLHCSCTSYATPTQRQFLLNFIDTMVEAIDIQA